MKAILKSPKVYAFFILLILVSIIILKLYSKTLFRINEIKFPPYAYSELLINYSSGIIRRALIGTIIQFIFLHSSYSLASIVNIQVFIQYLFFLTGFLYVASIYKASIYKTILLLIIPGGLFWAINSE